MFLKSETTLTEIEKAYIAGFFDGEGCVFVETSSKKSNMRIMFTNTNYEVLVWIQQKIGGNISTWKNKLPHCRTAYELIIHSEKAKRILLILLPYLKVKKKQAELAIQFQRTIWCHKPYGVPLATQQLRQEIANQIRGLNSKHNAKSEVSV